VRPTGEGQGRRHRYERRERGETEGVAVFFMGAESKEGRRHLLALTDLVNGSRERE
jgi:hypothetical protein